MAYSFPRTLAQFADLLKVDSVRPILVRNEEMALAGSGEWLSAKLAPDLWRFEVTTAWQKHDAIAAALAELEALGSQNTAMLYNPARAYPIADPTGSLYGGASPLIASINASRLQMALKDCVAGQIVSKGDMLQIDYDSGSRVALVRVGETATANGSGNTAQFQVTPALRAAVSINDAVTVIKPAAKVKIAPESASVEAGRDGFSRIVFTAVQTLEAD